jgi:putative ABC transport system permease protein
VKLGGSTLVQLSIRDGKPLSDTESGAVLLGNGLAESLKKRSGEKVEIEGQSFRVAGVFQATNPFDANSIVAPLGDVQKLMERPQVVSEIQVRAADSARTEDQLNQICGAIESLRGADGQPLGLKAQRTQEFVDSATEGALGKAMAWATTAIVLSLSMLGMLNTMLMSVLERTRELGILRAIGWRPSRVIRLILGESFAISLIAAGFGLGASWLLLNWMSYWPRTSLLVPHGLSETAMATGGLAALVAGVAGSVYPAVRASRIPPIEALRHE